MHGLFRKFAINGWRGLKIPNQYDTAATQQYEMQAGSERQRAKNRTTGPVKGDGIESDKLIDRVTA